MININRVSFSVYHKPHTEDFRKQKEDWFKVLREQIIKSVRRQQVEDLAKLKDDVYHHVYFGYIHHPRCLYADNETYTYESIIPLFYSRGYGVITDYGTSNGNVATIVSMLESGSIFIEEEPSIVDHKTKPRIQVYKDE